MPEGQYCVKYDGVKYHVKSRETDESMQSFMDYHSALRYKILLEDRIAFAKYTGSNAVPSNAWYALNETLNDDVNLAEYSERDDDGRNAANDDKYETKDSGVRAEYDSGMVRDTGDGKARFDLLLPQDVPYEKQMLTRWAQLMERGEKKYGARNWEQADSPEEYERYKASALRHMMQWLAGETDEDHAAAVMFNIMGAEYVKWRRDYFKTWFRTGEKPE